MSRETPWNILTIIQNIKYHNINNNHQAICDIRHAFEELDVSHDGLVTYPEFYSVLKKNGMGEGEIRQAFDSLDLEHNK